MERACQDVEVSPLLAGLAPSKKRAVETLKVQNNKSVQVALA
jgi:hypothetical protein